jgi:NAD(P)-dependent dehydrogenase (short-subunit alcohol dehydrogenase family)
METSLLHETVLIIGAGSGIGREMAQKFAAHGAGIVSLDVNEAGNARTPALVPRAGGKCDAVAGDVASAADV